jgi:hypothetical protein
MEKVKDKKRNPRPLLRNDKAGFDVFLSLSFIL